MEKLLGEAAVSEEEKMKLRHILGDKLASMDITMFFKNEKFLTRSKAAMVNVRCEEPKDVTNTAIRSNSTTTSTTTAVSSVPLPIKIPHKA